MKKHTTESYPTYKVFQEWNSEQAQQNVAEYIYKNRKRITEILKEEVEFNLTFSKVEKEHSPFSNDGETFAGVTIEFNVSKANQKALASIENKYIDSTFIYESCLFAWEEIALDIAEYLADNLLYVFNGKIYLQIDFRIIEQKELFADESNNVYFETAYGDIVKIGYEKGGQFKFC